MPSLEPQPSVNGIADHHHDPPPQHSSYRSSRDDALPQLTSNVYKPNQPRRPVVSTNIAPRAHRFGVTTPQDDASPDPHDFYRLGQEHRIGDGTSEDIGGGMPRSAVSRPTRRSRPSSPRSTIETTRTLSPIGSRISNARHVLSAKQDRTPLTAAKSSPTLANAPRNRQTSLKELVNKFNQTPDEVPPIPTKSTSRSPSASSSIRVPFNNWSGSGSQKGTPTRGYSGSFSSDAPSTTGSRFQNRRRGRTHAESPTSPRTKNNHVAETSKRAPSASQSMMNLAHDGNAIPRKPLFGELFVASPSHPPVGYGIPGPKRRRGSEGSMNSPNPLYADPTYLRHRDPSPSSSAAWYYEHAPTLDEIKARGDLPDHPPHIHRRTRSESKAFSAGPVQAQRYTNTLSPPSSPPANDSSRRSSQSRIPISTRRISINSDSENPKSPTNNHAPRNYKPSKTSTRNRAPPPNPLSNIRTSPKYSRSSTPQKSPRHHAGNHRPASSPRLAAYISEPLPKKSPPLRSSRPRQPVSSASTSASRAKAVEKFGTDQNRYPTNRESRPRKPPELGAVDFAARRQKIQQAFTKTVKEEEEREIRRLSMAQESQPTRTNAQQKLDEQLPILEDSMQESSSQRSQSVDHEHRRGNRESQTTEPELTVDTSRRTDRSMLDLEDSPTLGTFHTHFVADNGTNQFNGSSPNSDIDPGSANTVETTDSVDTFFDDEPQDEPGESTTAQATTLPNVAMQDSASSLANRRRFEGVEEAESGDDQESIQIMLGATPVLDKATFHDDYDDRSRDAMSSEGPDSRWSVSTWTSSIRSDERDSLEPIEEREADQTEAPAHLSLSSTASEHTPPTWSPSSHDSTTTDRTTLDSDRYNPINRVLDQYRDPGREAPQEAQQQVYNQSPDLMRQGGYDPRKVTQLYMQKMAQDRIGGTGDGSKVHISKRTSSLQPLPHIVSEKEVRTDMNEKMLPGPSHSRNLSASSANDQDIDEHGNLKPARASLSRPDDFDMSPSLGGFTEMAADTPSEEKPPLPEKDAPFLRNQRPMETYEASPTVYHSEDYSRPQLPPMNFGHSLAINVEPPQGAGPSSGPPPVPAHSPPPPPISKPAVGDFADPTRVLHSSKASKPADASSMSRDGPMSNEAASKNSSPSPEQKRLTRRCNIIKELVDTEHSFGQDMKVVDDIYKGTSNVIILQPDDVKTLFGNSDQIVSFSTGFVDSLKQASKPVYVLAKSKRWKSNRVSNATSYSTTGDESSLNGPDLTDDERDRKTFIGDMFVQYMPDMEKIYTEYLKNHDAANQKLLQLQNNQKVQIWLKECKAYASDLTTAWDLDSLLVKPVQRILKYPLLLDQLLEVTPNDHPDYTALESAAKEMKEVSMRINETKKRADILVQANNNSSRKRKDSDMRTGLAKAFGAGKKLRQQVGTTSSFEDKEYNAIADRYSEHFVRLQIMMRDVEMYSNDVENWVRKFLDFAIAMEAHIDVGQTSYPELESKWRKFRSAMREMLTMALPDHIESVQKHVVQPIQSLVKLHDGPQRMMAKRNKRLPDYARFRAVSSRGDKPDKKTTEQGEQFLAFNETLKKEVPKMHELTGRLMERCLGNFVQLQYKWLKLWKSKLKLAIDLHTSAQDGDFKGEVIKIVRAFTQDFAFYDTQVASLAICNGALLNETPNLVQLTSPATSSTTMVGDSSFTGDGFQSPRTGPSFDSRRTHSISSEQSPILPQPDFGDARGNGSFFPMGDPQLSGPTPQRQSSSNRARAGSNMSNKTPQTPIVPGSWRSYSSNTTPVQSTPGRSNNASNRTANEPGPSLRPSIESSRINRFSDESGLTRPSPGPGYASSAQPRSTSPGGNRFSGYFSSAMPMSDSPTMESPAPPTPQQEFNIIFLAASVYEFNIDRARKEAGYPYLTYVAGEIFDVIGEKGELWLAKNQDDRTNLVGWIWNKHFVKLAS